MTIYKCWCSASLSSKYCSVAFGQVPRFSVCHSRSAATEIFPEGFLTLVEMTFKHLCVTRVFRKQFFHCQFSPEHALLIGKLDQVLHVVVVLLQALVKRARKS